jgi:hypothetical protein
MRALALQEVTLQNANAWATLREDVDEEGQGPEKGNNDDEEGPDDANDNLWAEFQSREEEQKKRV